LRNGPSRSAAGEVIIEVTYNGLCGTDATEYTKGPLMVPLEVPHTGSGHVGPTILGHEFIGVVVDAAPDARTWPGGGSRAVRACPAGLRLVPSRADQPVRAVLHLGLSTHGGLAQFVAAPVSTLRPIPEDCADIEAALAQPLAVGLHAVSRAGVRPGDSGRDSWCRSDRVVRSGWSRRP
jgi:(R,R)-butanediol dehydrogenase/meso-butanediol dehydrogenase/diacetyl reductase